MTGSAAKISLHVTTSIKRLDGLTRYAAKRTTGITQTEGSEAVANNLINSHL